LISTLSGHNDVVWELAFSPDGKTLASVSADGSAYLWRLSDEMPAEISLPANIEPEKDSAIIPLTSREHIRSLVFTPDKTGMFAGTKSGKLLYWSLPDLTEPVVLAERLGNVSDLAISADGTLLASATDDKYVRLWQIAPATPENSSSPLTLMNTLEGHTNLVLRVAFSNVNKYLASASSDGSVRIWDVSTYRLLATLPDHSGSVMGMAFSPDGTLVATGSEDPIVRLWQVTGITPIRQIANSSPGMYHIALSPDGKIIAAGSEDNRLILRNASDGSILALLKEHTGRVSSLAFSPDGKSLASGAEDKSVRLWQLTAQGATLKETLTGHTADINDVAFSPDGKIIASASDDMEVRLWDSETGELLFTLSGSKGRVMRLAFSPDGTRLATGSSDRILRIWDVSNG